MQDMTSLSHQLHVLKYTYDKQYKYIMPYITYHRGAVYTLAILYRSFKQVLELLFGTKIVRSNEVYHTPILQQIVLYRIASCHYSPPRKKGNLNKFLTYNLSHLVLMFLRAFDI